MRKLFILTVILALVLCSCRAGEPPLPPAPSPSQAPTTTKPEKTSAPVNPTEENTPTVTPEPEATQKPTPTPPPSMPEPTPNITLVKSGPLVKMADGRHLYATGADIIAGAEALATFDVESKYCSELMLLIRRGHPNGTDVVVINGSEGYNLLYYYEHSTRAFDDDYEISSKYSVQLTLYDLDGDSEDEVLLFTGNGGDDTELIIFEIRADGLEHIGGLYSINCFEIDGQLIKYAFYDLSIPFETIYKNEQFDVITGTFPENAS